MDRRKVLIRMGLSIGYVVAVPTFVGLLQSCKDEKTVAWVPTFLSEGEGSLLKTIVDVVLPKTETPSASELDVHKFIDFFAAECLGDKQQEAFKITLTNLAAKAFVVSDKTEISTLTINDLTPIMKAAVTGKDIDELPFAKKLRDLVVWGYKCNEYVGEEVLAYLPVPGEYIPCGDLNELTEGRAWSE
ncbi:gluconate 2-dehydrogenase subunit 3 family protein [Cellulophaga sp. Z1A5H]|uniref:gluconate 2-dehydrogenase subunit 3 family protein n=1 Tax=Cellulophaga sp. Z1A5H TaxID=2687291 RepID=UPI0013FDAB0D|nr:gluconate 2-dehydrogenase subunit 3 family protein [Cellulophaga sp. Z1A5H]